MSCNSCIQINPIPQCYAEGGENLIDSLSAPNAVSQDITVTITNTATDFSVSNTITTDVDGNFDIDLTEFSMLPFMDHVYKITALDENGRQIDLRVTDLETAEYSTACCIEFGTRSDIVGDNWVPQLFFCADRSGSDPSPSDPCETCPSDEASRLIENAADRSTGSDELAFLSDLPPVTPCDNCPSDDASRLIEDAATRDSGTDQLAFLSDLNIVVGQTYLMPENFSDGKTLGNGTIRTLASLGYNDTTAGNYWTRVNSAYTIDVNTMSIDWIAWQELELFKYETGANAVTLVGGKGYCPSQSILITEDQSQGAAYARSLQMVYNLNGSAFANRTGNDFRIFDVYPANHAQANGFQLVYQYTFRDGYFYGNGSANDADCAIRIGARSHCNFHNLGFTDFGIEIDAQFALQFSSVNCRFNSYGKYGIRVGDGLYTGAGLNTDQSNNILIAGPHFYSGTGLNPVAGIYSYGNRNVDIYKPTFEGDTGSEHGILYEALNATTVKNSLTVYGSDWEAGGYSKGAITIRGNNIQAFIERFNIQTGPSDMPIFVNAEYYGSYIAPMYIRVEDQAAYNPGWKFRQKGQQKWDVRNVVLNNRSNLDAAENWNTVDGGTSIPTSFRHLDSML